MNGDQDQQKKLIDTTDCLEAISVFKGWKNAFFIILVIGLFLIQTAFWFVNMGKVKSSDKPIILPSAPSAEPVKEPNQASTQSTQTANLIAKAAKEVVADVNQSAKIFPQPGKMKFDFSFTITQDWMTLALRLVNFLLIAVGLLYCLTILFCLKVSLIGRFGGINHISRALFLSLLFLVFFLPWQRFFDGMFAGYLFNLNELLDANNSLDKNNTFNMVFFYLRYVGYWLLAVLFLILTQWRSYRWSKTILRRLEVV